MVLAMMQVYGKCLWMQTITLPKTNIAPENG